jgi:hypothetical protein
MEEVNEPIWYCVWSPRKDIKLFNNWLDGNCIGKYSTRSYHSCIRIYLSNKDDIVLFKLRFL